MSIIVKAKISFLNFNKLAPEFVNFLKLSGFAPLFLCVQNQLPLFLHKIVTMNYVLIAHNILRWGVLFFGLWTLLNALSGVFGKRKYTAADNKSNLLFMIFCDIQLLIGLILYFNGIWFTMLKTNAKEVMKDNIMRFFALEHVVMMIIAWLLVHIGRSMVKRSNNDAQKHKRMLLYFGLAFLIIIAMIPWPFRATGIGRALFPQF